MSKPARSAKAAVDAKLATTWSMSAWVISSTTVPSSLTMAEGPKGCLPMTSLGDSWPPWHSSMEILQSY